MEYTIKTIGGSIFMSDNLTYITIVDVPFAKFTVTDEFKLKVEYNIPVSSIDWIKVDNL